MKLSQSEKSLLFSSTEIPDIFFAEYLPETNGDSLKVYLYMLFLSKYNKEDIKINDLSKNLSMQFPDVKDALEELEEKGLLVKTADGYILSNIQEVEIAKQYSPKVTSSPETAVKNAENQYRAKVVDTINSQFFQGVMSPTWFNDIDFWFDKYGFDDQVMWALFNYCSEKRALHRNYVQATAEGWSKNNIKTFNDLDNFWSKQDKRSKLCKSIATKLNLFRPLTSYEEEDVIKWTENYGYDIDIIEIALKKASSQNKISFDYIDTLITDWHKKDLRNTQDVNDYVQSLKTKDKKTKQLEQKSFEYTQSTFDNLDSLYDN